MTRRQRHDTLERARELVAAGWTTGAYCRSPAGWAVALDSERAIRFDAAGAVYRAAEEAGVSDGRQIDELLAELTRYVPWDFKRHRNGAFALERFNDHPNTTRRTVLRVFDRTIASLNGGNPE